MRNSYFYSKNKLMYLPMIAIAVFTCLTTVSCGQVTMRDSSLEPSYTAIIGKKFRVKEDLWALGITTDKNYKKRLDYIVLVPGVGFSGPEVVSRDRLSKDSVIKIVRVLTAKSLISSKVVYIVEEVDSNKFKDAEIRVKLVGSSDDLNLGLDKLVYELID